MDINTTDKKYSSKLHTFFDLVYKLLVINIMTVIVSLPIITIFPMIVAATATIKNDLNQTGIFKPLFKNFAKYFLRAFLMGLVLILIFGSGLYAVYFWSKATTESKTTEIIMQIAVVVVPVCLIIFIFMTVHIPLLMITFEKLTNYQIFKTSLYVSIRYFITTLIMLFAVLFIIGILVLCLFIPGVLAIWMILGISLPLYLVVKVTMPVYYKFAKIDFEEISEQARKDLEDE